MLNDEQILAKTNELLSNLQEKCWKGYEKKGMKTMFGKQYPNCVKKSKKKKRKNEEIELYEEKVLREITEDEMRVLEDVLDDLDPTNLPLNDLFSNKMRVVIPFPTLDPESDLGKFAKFFRDQEYEVEWDKGMVYAEREHTGGTLDFLMGQPYEKKSKKIQMKIGKLFPKIAQTASKLDELFQIIKKEGEGKAWWNNATRPGQVARNIAVKVLSDEQLKSWGRLVDQMYEYIPAPGYFEPKWDETVEYLQKMSKYWQQNAGYIKDEINNIDNDKYSIIITRHPIDVLRMSDFDNITSCHSPASRTNAYQSYYKCAVAEAQGHGAVAYVVETEDLLSATNTGNIDSAEQEIQEGEIFYDDQRQFVGGIEPISRTRIRHVRYYDTDTPKRYDDGQDVGMPEARIYGAGIPGIVDRVTDWARNNQEEVIENMPKNDNGIIDLNKFMIFGGSYEDTANAAGREKLMRQLLGPEALVSGNMKQNTDTEDNLDANLIGDVLTQYEEECDLIKRRFNQRMAACSVDYNVDEDGGDGVFIRGSAMIKLEWEADDWVKLPNTWDRTVFHSAQELNDIFGDIFYDDPYLAKENGPHGGIIKWECNINIEHPTLGGSSYMALTEEFEEMCEKIDVEMDDKRDGFREILSNYFRREGYMQGGEYMNLAINIENRDVTSYEWDLETDGDYEDSYESTASYSFDYDPEQLNITLPVLMKLLDSREFRIQIRRNLLAMPQRNVDTEYFLQMNMSVIEVAGEARTTVKFFINRDEPDEMATLFQELVEGDMDDEEELTRVFARTLAQIRQQAGQWPEQDSSATQGLNEHLVKTWKRFLSN
jgi:hypothetical protein